MLDHRPMYIALRGTTDCRRLWAWGCDNTYNTIAPKTELHAVYWDYLGPLLGDDVMMELFSLTKDLEFAC